MTLEGLLEFEHVRDFLYSRMRGRARRGAHAPHAGDGDGGDDAPASRDRRATEDLAAVLTEVAAELRGVRLALEARRDRSAVT